MVASVAVTHGRAAAADVVAVVVGLVVDICQVIPHRCRKQSLSTLDQILPERRWNSWRCRERHVVVVVVVGS